MTGSLSVSKFVGTDTPHIHTKVGVLIYLDFVNILVL